MNNINNKPEPELTESNFDKNKGYSCKGKLTEEQKQYLKTRYNFWKAEAVKPRDMEMPENETFIKILNKPA